MKKRSRSLYETKEEAPSKRLQISPQSRSGIELPPQSRSGIELFNIAMNYFGNIAEPKLQDPYVQDMKEKLNNALRGVPIKGVSEKKFIVTSDPMEEFDDIVMIRFVIYQMENAYVTVILSGGEHSPDARLRNVKNIFPDQFGQAEMNVPIRGQNGTQITFVSDGGFNPQIGQYDAFVNCGPSSAETLDNIVASLKNGATVVTVGANDDPPGTVGAARNQKFTVANTVQDDKDRWNQAIDSMNGKNCSIKNVSVHISRYVLFPNPINMAETPYGGLANKEEFFGEAVGTTGMFLCSRPPPKFGGRVNFSNSCVDYQLCKDMLLNAQDHPGYQEGIENIEAYSRYSEHASQINKGSYGMIEGVPDQPPEVLAAIPLMCTALLGGVRKKGDDTGEGNEGYFFGSAPNDRDSKMNHAWVHGGVEGPFGQAVKALPFFTPAYDPIAVLMAIDNMSHNEMDLETGGGRRRGKSRKNTKKKRKSKNGDRRKKRKTKKKRRSRRKR